jgi:hypothetical protein
MAKFEIFQHLPEGSEENHKKKPSGWLVFRPRFE